MLRIPLDVHSFNTNGFFRPVSTSGSLQLTCEKKNNNNKQLQGSNREGFLIEQLLIRTKHSSPIFSLLPLLIRDNLKLYLLEHIPVVRKNYWVVSQSHERKFLSDEDWYLVGLQCCQNGGPFDG